MVALALPLRGRKTPDLPKATRSVLDRRSLVTGQLEKLNEIPSLYLPQLGPEVTHVSASKNTTR